MMEGGAPEPAREPIAGQLELEIVEADLDASAETSGPALVEPRPITDGRPPALRKVWLRRFKSFEDLTVDLGRFNVLVGANNSGKSTLLQGIDLLFSLLKLHRDGDRLASQGRYFPASVLPVAAMKDLFFRRETRRANRPLPVEIGAEFTDGSSVEFGIQHLFGSMNSRVQAAHGIEGERLASLLGHPAVWVPSAVGIVRDEEYRTPARRTALINAGRHNEVLRNLLFDLHQEHPDRYELLQEILRERFAASFSHVSFDDARDEFVQADMAAAGDVTHDLYSAGSGYVQVVQLLAFILTQSPSIVLLDEPDAHLHSSLQRAIVEILEDIGRDQGLQILIATHSKEIINFIDPSRLIFVQAGESSAAPMSHEVTPIAVLRSLGAIDNIDAFALVKNRKCLFVEGSSDATILGRFATTLRIHAFTGDDRVVVIPTGGADRFGHVQQLDVFEQLLGASIASLELRDRDARTDEDREHVMQATRPLFVFSRDSIESYLLEPTVVAGVTKEVALERDREIDVEPADIEQLLEGLTDDLRTSTVDRVAQRYLEHRRRLTGDFPPIPEANETARTFVDAQWGTLEGRLIVVSGKKLLGALRNEIQNRYGVNFGNERLAEGFEPAEVPTDIRNALEEVARLSPPVSDEGAG